MFHEGKGNLSSPVLSAPPTVCWAQRFGIQPIHSQKVPRRQDMYPDSQSLWEKVLESLIMEGRSLFMVGVDGQIQGGRLNGAQRTQLS